MTLPAHNSHISHHIIFKTPTRTEQNRLHERVEHNVYGYVGYVSLPTGDMIHNRKYTKQQRLLNI